MDDLIQAVNSPEEITRGAARLREVAFEKELLSSAVLELFEKWAAALQGVGMEAVPGVAFLRLWLRQGTIEPILERELGRDSLNGGWRSEGRAKLKVFPLGTVGHWPAGNIEIQPVLSMTCALLGGNSCLVRVPTALVEPTRQLVEKLRSVDQAGILLQRVALVSFDHSRDDLQTAMAQSVDGAMIGAVQRPSRGSGHFPFRIGPGSGLGPRLSVAAMDAAVWNDEGERLSWCQRIARDVWQFEQQACSSPQALFLERGSGGDIGRFVEELRRAFAEENRVHPRREMHPALTSAICFARASWLLGDTAHNAWFPSSPDWTILLGTGTEIPKPTQGRTLSILVVEDLREVIANFDGTVQTLGLAIANPQKEEALAQAAGRRGVDRIVKLGRMHVFGSPWDGVDLIRPMVRVVRHVPSQD